MHRGGAGTKLRLSLVAPVLVAIILPCAAFAQAPSFITQWGTLGTGPGQFNGPYGIAVDGSGNVYVVDNGNNRVEKFSNTGAFVTQWGTFGSGTGQFNNPTFIAVDKNSNVYVSDRNNSRIQKFTSSGTYITHWGNGSDPQYGSLVIATGLAVNLNGDVFSADEQQDRIVKFTSNGAYITKWGIPGFSNGQFNRPEGVAADASGNVYVVEQFSNFRIQKFNSAGGFLTKWGTYGTGDGQIAESFGLAVDAEGNLYVADTENQRIQVFSSTGTFLTKWGTLGTGAGQFTYPFGVAVDANGNIFVADGGNSRIQKFGPMGGGFVDATHGPLAAGAGLSQGVAWGDYDNDGDLDLYLAKNGGANQLFRNDGVGGFVDATSGPLGDTGQGQGVAWGDYDNDGDLDLYLSNTGSANKLLRNEGGGVFANATSGPLGYTGQGSGVAWGDYDRDGDIDLYLANWAEPNKLFRNDGGGVFADETSGPLGDSGQGVGVAWGDYDNDGDPDLYLSNAGQANKLFRNDGGGVFTDATSGPLGDTGQGQGVAWGDYDNDADLDLFLANNGQSSKLFRNEGGGVFADATSGPLGTPGASTNVAWGDFDNDGDLDLYLTNFSQPNKLFRNDGGGVFANATSAPVGNPSEGRGAAWGDYDQDGDLDIYQANFGSANKLFRNEDVGGNHWLQVTLVGTASNRSGIGARAYVRTGGLRQMQEVSGGSGYLSQNSLPLEFGLGSATTVDTLEVRWPSGVVQKVIGVAVDQAITVQEVVFTDVTSGPLAGPGNGFGVAWGDYDQDGDLDLYATNASLACKLYRNEGSGSFADATVAPLNIVGFARGAPWGDYDNDGDLDLFVAFQPGSAKLFRNEGAGAFVDATSGPLGDFFPGTGVAWADYDRDGDLDVYAAGSASDRLYRNEGAGGFVIAATFGAFGAFEGVAWGDVDGDGDPDLALAHTGGPHILRNDGGTTFSNITPAFLTVVLGGRGVAWGDYDNDGDLDLYLSRDGGPDKLVRNDGNGAFSDAAVGAFGDDGDGRGVAWGDYDNDGYLDLYLVNYNSAARLLHNDGHGGFADVASGSLAGNGPGQGVAWGDYDGDGDLDLYAVSNDVGGNRLLRNDVSGGNHWLHVDLHGTTSNRMGVGARVRAVAGSLIGMREVSGGSGFLSQDSPLVEFGLGANTSVDTLEIRWPSGITQRLTNIAANQKLTVLESQWTDVATGAAADSSQSRGCAWGDYDNDGDQDLYVAVNGPNKLLRNEGGNVFVDVATATIRSASGVGTGVGWGDYDNDGDLDLYLTNLSGDTNRLFRNEGGGNFSDATTGPLGSSGQTRAGIWGDYDRDGDIDLYLTHVGPNQLLRNDGSGVFADVTTGDLGDPSDSRRAAWVDADNDGDLDLYVSNHLAPNRMLRNDGISGFVDVASGPLANNAQGRVTAWGDYDNDGDLDVFLAIDFGADKLLRNDGGFNFADITPAILANPDRGLEGEWADYDNDGDLDLYTTAINNLRQHLYRNEGGGVFADATSGELGDHQGNGFSPGGLAWGDSDGDGDLDVYVTWVGKPSRLFRNENVTRNHWLQIVLRGTVSNRSAIGARVRARAGAISQIREVSGGMESQESLPVEFGFGVATVVDTLEVKWPSGQKTTLTSVPVDRAMTVTEPLTVPTGGTFPLTVWAAPADEEGIPGALGSVVDGAGDVNGDGFQDVLVGSSQGKALLFLGGATSDQIPDLILRSETPGAAPYEDFGLALAGVGDVNKDGFDDWVVGAKSHNGIGRAYLYLGGSALNGTPDIVLDGQASGDMFGGSVAGLGDLNGDGYDDWAIGAGGNDAGGTNAGRVYVYFGGATPNGTPDLSLTGVPTEDFYARTVAGGGDLNHDGFDDILVGASGGKKVRVYLGGSAVNSLVDLIVSDPGGHPSNEFCRSLSMLGDVNGDGFDDFSIDGKDFLSGSMREYVYLGGASLDGTADLTLNTPGNSALTASLGDINGDGFKDFAVGDPEASSGGRHGAVSVFYGRQILSTTPNVVLRGQTSASALGLSVTGCGDVNGDEVDDLVAGDPIYALPNPPNGRAYVFLGAASWVNVASGVPATTTDGNGVAWVDHDGDGDLDLYVSRFTAGSPKKLFRNDGASTFIDVTLPPLNDTGAGRGLAWADFDNDGDLDLYVSNSGAANRLFRNDGSGIFADIANGGLVGQSANRGVAWGDYDNDGDVDLYLVSDENKLFRNDGAGSFADVTVPPLNDVGQPGRAAAWGDMDGDNDLDLYIVNNGTASKLLRNDAGTFVNVTSGPLGSIGLGKGAEWGDYDNDGDLDLYLVNEGSANKLLRNDGGGAFSDATAGPLGIVGTGNTAAWGDVDNDGDLDLYLTNQNGEANTFFRNQGSGVFVDATIGALKDSGDGRGAAWGDYDQDGDLDLAFTNIDTGLRLLRNDLSLGNHWLQVKTVGQLSNRAGIGARVQAVAGGVRQTRVISGGSGSFSQAPLIAAFGLGSTSTVDSLIVVWPSGVTQVRTNIAADQVLTLQEAQFTEIAQTALNNGVDDGVGVAWADYDKDGDLDFFVSNEGQDSRLYRNEGGGNFVETTPTPLKNAAGPGEGVAWGDYDNDGDLDLFLVNGTTTADRLFRNDGGASFVDVAAAAGVADVGNGRGAAWGDYDRDGDLDLYLVNNGSANRLFRNEGAGTFVNVAAGDAANAGSGFGAAWADYDHDGDLDLCFANNAGGPNSGRILRNDGGSSFNAVFTLGQPGLGVAWADYDNDGDMDVFIAGASNQLRRNDGAGIFVSVASTLLVNAGQGNQGGMWGDYDNDGDLDLYINAAAGDKLCRNEAGGVFVDATDPALASAGEGRGCAWADYDNDGDLDLCIANLNGPDRLFRNESTNRYHWLEVNLVGTASNRSAIGARVRARTGALSQVREISGGSGYLSQNSLTEEFGLKNAATVDTLEIRWPSGITQVLRSVATNQRLTVTEPSGGPDVTALDKTAAPNTGTASLSIAGIRLDGSSLSVSLTGPSTIPATSIPSVSSTTVTATFNLTGAPTGTYNLSFVTAGGSDALNGALVVHDGGIALHRSTTSNALDMDPAYPHTAGPQDTVVFVSARGGAPNLYIKNPDAFDTAPLTALTSLGSVANPSFSPNGRKIVFDNAGSLYILDLQTMAAPTVLTAGTRPQWAPSGERIAFQGSLSGGRQGIFSIQSTGTGLTQLTDPPTNGVDSSPTWSPDGKEIAFSRQILPGPNHTVYVISALGGESLKKQVMSIPGAGPGLAGLSWSPDGRWLAVAIPTLGTHHIDLIDSRGESFGLLQITQGSTDDTKPSWNADGSALSFVSNYAGNQDIYVVSGIAALTDDDADLVPNPLDDCVSTAAHLGQVDRDFNGCGDPTSSFRFSRFWSPDQVPISYQTTAQGDPRISDDSEFASLQAAFNAWTGVSGVALSGGDDATRAGPREVITGDGKNSITFGDENGFIPGTLAVTLSTVAEADTVIAGRWYRPGEIVDADILFNTSEFHFSTATTVPTTDAYDLRAVATHEFGHFFGLAHTAVVGSTMYVVVPRNTSPWSLEQDDIALVRRGYAADTTRSIEGRVLRPDGVAPVVGAAVLAISSSAPIDTLQMTVTGTDGVYRFYDLNRSFRIWVTPLDGSDGVNDITASYINADLASVVETNFLPEYWDDGTETNHDTGTGVVTTRPGPFVPNANIILNVDVDAPQITSTSPANGALDVPATGAITIQFSEKMDFSSVDSTDIALRNLDLNTGVGGVAAGLEDNTLIAFTPNGPLAYATNYRFTIKAGIKDLAGNSMADSTLVLFQTESQPPVTLVSTTPSSASGGGAIVIYGAGFDPEPSHNTINFPGATVHPTAATLDRMYAIVPTGAATGTITVTVGSNTSNGLTFSVLAPRAPPSANKVGERNLGAARPRKMDIAPDGSFVYVATDRGVSAIPTFPASLVGASTDITISGGCTGVIAMPDGTHVLAVRPSAPELQVLDVANPSNIHLVRQISLGAAPIDLAVVPGGAEVVVSFPEKLALLNTPSDINDPQFGTFLREWTDPAGPFLGPVSVSRDGNTIFAATGDNRFTLFDRTDGSLLGSLRSGASPRESVPAPDGESAFGVDLAGEILEFDNLGALRTLISGGGGYVGIAVSPEGDFAYAADLILNRVDVLDLNVAMTTRIASFDTGIDPIDIAVNPDGSTIYVLTESDRKVEAYDTIEGPYIASVSPSSGGTGTLITLAGSHFNPTPSANLVSMGDVVLTPVSVDPSGASLVVKQTSAVTEGHIAVTTGGKTSNVVEYKVLNRSDPGNFALTPAFPAEVTGLQSMVRSPDGRLVIVRGSDGTLTALGESPLRTQFHRAIASLNPTASGLSGPGLMILSPDGATLYAAHRGASRIRVYTVNPDSPTPLVLDGDVQDGGAPAVLDAASLDITPDGTRIYAASPGDNKIYEIATATRTISATLTGSFTAPSAIAVHPGGKRAYALLNDNGIGIRLAVFDIDPNSGSYRTRIATVVLAGATSMRQVLAAPGGNRVYALIGNGSVFRLKQIDSDSASPNYHLEVGSVQVGSGSLVPMVLLNQSGTLAFVADPGTTSLKTLSLTTFTFTSDLITHAGLTGAKALAISREDARLYVGSGSSILLADLTEASNLAFVSGTSQVGVENQTLTFPLVVRSTPADEGAAVTYEVVGSGGFGASDSYGYTALDATGVASESFTCGTGAGARTVRAKLSGTTIETSVTVVTDTTLVPVQLVTTSPATDIVLGVLTSVGSQFSKGVRPSSVSAATFPVKRLGSVTPVPGTYHFSDHERRITFVPTAPLEYGADYTAEATSGLLDYNGNPLSNPATFSFHTEAAPTVVSLTAITPNAGTIGDPVVISGDGFEPSTSGNTVRFGPVIATVERADPKALVARIPDGAESGLLTVTARGVTSDAVTFDVIVPSPEPVSDPSGSITLPTSGNQVVVTPDEARAYMTSPEGNSTVPIFLDTRASEEPIPVGIYPLGIAISPDGKRTYVANYYSGDVSVIDTDAGSGSFQDVVATIPIGGNPIAAVANPNGRELYVASAGNTGDVMVVDTDIESNTYTAKKTIETGSSNQTVTVTTDGGQLIVGTAFGIVLIDIEGDDYGAKKTIETGSGAQSVTVTPDGGYALVLTNTGVLLLIDIKPGSSSYGTAKKSIETGSTSQAVTVSPDGGQIYVSTSDGQILIFTLNLSGGDAASSEPSNSGFSIAPLDTVSVGENLIGMAFAGRDRLLIVDAGERRLHLLGGGTAVIPCSGDTAFVASALLPSEWTDSVTVNLTGGAIQLRAFLSWTPGGANLDLALYQRTGTNPVTGTLIREVTGSAAPESLLVQGLAAGTYFFEVRRVSPFGTQINWSLSTITCVEGVIGTPEPERSKAPAYVLLQSFPNPFRAGGAPARIRFALHDPGNVRLDVFDVRGGLVRTLASGWMDRGEHEVSWDGRTEQGASAAAGVYFYRLQAERRFVKTQRLLLLR